MSIRSILRERATTHQTETFHSDTLDTDVTVKLLTGAEFEEFMVNTPEEGGYMRHFRAKLIACTILDEAGQLVYNKDSKQDINQIEAMPNDVVEELGSKILNIVGTGDSSVEELAKN